MQECIVELIEMRERRCFKGQTMTDVSTCTAQEDNPVSDIVWEKKKASSFFIMRVVGSGCAFVITLSGSTCGLWVYRRVRCPVEASPSRRLILARVRKGGKGKKRRGNGRKIFPSFVRFVHLYVSFFSLFPLIDRDDLSERTDSLFTEEPPVKISRLFSFLTFVRVSSPFSLARKKKYIA